MITRLVWRSFLRRPGRSALLLAGYALGVAVTVALLSIGGALLAQSRDRTLVGGGDLTVLPAGLDLETFRTGGASSLHFTMEHAPFLYRQVLAGPRFRGRIRAAAPWLDDELLYLRLDGETVPVTAGGEIPSRAAAMEAAPRVLRGAWEDVEADRRWMAPSDSALYAEIDAFHRPPPEARGDAAWAEWHYFNVVLPEDRGWLYLTYLAGGAGEDRGGGLLATWVGPPDGDGRRPERAWARKLPARAVRLSTAAPDLALGDAEVRLDGRGRYRIRAVLPAGPGPALRVDLTLVPEGRRYLPPLDVSGGGFPSGYVAPVLRGRAEGRACAGRECVELSDAPAYHDHNWGVWEDVTWDWGVARLGDLDVLYGGVRRAGEEAGGRFLFVTDSLGFAGLLPVTDIRYRYGAVAGPDPAGADRRPAAGGSAAVGAAAGGTGAVGGRAAGTRAPAALLVEARRGSDSLVLRVEVEHARATPRAGGWPGGDAQAGGAAIDSTASGPLVPPGGAAGRDGAAPVFFQMRGRARLEGRLGGEEVDARGDGFFETWSEGEGSARHP